MKIFLVIAASTVNAFIFALMFLMFARTIMSFFPDEEETRAQNFVYSVTEPVLLPVRSVLMRFDFFASSPVDFSMTFTFLILMLVMMFLPTL